jgi:hypothetical protein
VIGTVDVYDRPGEPPHVTAMRLIAEHDTEGTFTFPMRDGRTCRVSVEFTEPNQPERHSNDGHR